MKVARLLCVLSIGTGFCRPSLLSIEQVSMSIKSDLPDDTGRRLLSAWNDPGSRLHVGAITGLIDFAQVCRALSPAQKFRRLESYGSVHCVCHRTGSRAYRCLSFPVNVMCCPFHARRSNAPWTCKAGEGYSFYQHGGVGGCILSDKSVDY